MIYVYFRQDYVFIIISLFTFTLVYVIQNGEDFLNPGAGVYNAVATLCDFYISIQNWWNCNQQTMLINKTK